MRVTTSTTSNHSLTWLALLSRAGALMRHFILRVRRRIRNHHLHLVLLNRWWRRLLGGGLDVSATIPMTILDTLGLEDAPSAISLDCDTPCAFHHLLLFNKVVNGLSGGLGLRRRRNGRRLHWKSAHHRTDHGFNLLLSVEARHSDLTFGIMTQHFGPLAS
jgi:hypothetical protein